MSQHCWKAKIGSKRVCVQLGWDRPLSGFHCTITEDSKEERVIYCNLDDPALTGTGLASSVEHFAKVLAKLGVKVPAGMFDAVRKDGLERVGNKRVVYPDQI